jgi:hypothetical protein
MQVTYPCASPFSTTHYGPSKEALDFRTSAHVKKFVDDKRRHN